MIGRARTCLRLMADTAGSLRVATLVVLQFVVAVLEGLGLVLLVPVVQALGGEDTFSIPGLTVELTLTRAFSLVIAVVVLRGLGQWWTMVLAVDIRLATIDRLRLGLINDLYAADWSYLAAQRRSEVVQSLTTNVERAQSAIAMVLRLFVGSFVLIATAAVAILIAPVVGGLALAVVLLVLVLAARSTRGAAALGKVMTERIAGFGSTLSDSLGSARVMRAHGAERAWSELVEAEAVRVREVRSNFVARSSMVAATLGVVGVLAVLALILVGREVGLSLAELATLLVVATRLLASGQNLLVALQTFANDVPALEALLSFQEEARRHPERANAAVGPEVHVARVPREGRRRAVALVELHDVGVSYDNNGTPAVGDQSALTGINLEIPYRGLVTVTGPSGAGKSTLLDVILGLLRPDRGEMLVDGAAVTDLAAWRSRLGYVAQQTVLVPGTVWQNLAWSMQPGAALTEEEAWAALRLACVDDVVRGLPGQLQAPLQEIAELSGGEQQRLAIARALVRQPELLILDEATSALDADTERAVLANLLDGERAVLMVTHRGLVENPGVVLRLENGRGSTS